MKKWLILALAATAAPLAPAPLAAQNAPQNGTLVIYGNDKCPTDREGNEVVVCVRRPEAERFRIPKELRDAPTNPDSQGINQRAVNALSGAQTGTGSCSTVGPGGQTGCLSQEIRNARAEAKQREDAQSNIP